MHTRGVAGALRKMLPYFFGGEDQYRRDQPKERAADPVDGGLRGAARAVAGRKGVKPVFENVEIKRAQIHGRKIVHGMVDAVEIVAIVALAALSRELRCPV